MLYIMEEGVGQQLRVLEDDMLVHLNMNTIQWDEGEDVSEALLEKISEWQQLLIKINQSLRLALKH